MAGEGRQVAEAAEGGVITGGRRLHGGGGVLALHVPLAQVGVVRQQVVAQRRRRWRRMVMVVVVQLRMVVVMVMVGWWWWQRRRGAQAQPRGRPPAARASTTSTAAENVVAATVVVTTVVVAGVVVVAAVAEVDAGGAAVGGRCRRGGDGGGGAVGGVAAVGARALRVGVVVVVRQGGRLAVHLHVLAQRAGVGVALVATFDLTVVGLVARVHVRVFLAVGAVGEPPVTALELALKRLFTCDTPDKIIIIIIVFIPLNYMIEKFIEQSRCVNKYKVILKKKRCVVQL